ncbi:YbhB/YbcL family Raf kinase inhibitor-like protein [Massilia sp. W12]|uniref:YbhB/YbcL family Raf kinase inhibitor-like protein n=1 Tax=Massilia sp. W12 TaxID=3126507 RepID=UPI0030CE90B9
MKLVSNVMTDGQAIAEEFAFCQPDAAQRINLAPNRNPHLAWYEIPQATQSLVVICVDPDAPSVATDVNQEGKTIPADFPRADFYHWCVVDIPPALAWLDSGEMSDGVTARGKSGPQAAHPRFPDALRHGLNDYTNWFAADDNMRGQYFGYDGPCPPWNDARVHRYIFTVYALDIARLPLEGAFDARAVRAAMEGHILDQASLCVTYTLNPALRQQSV